MKEISSMDFPKHGEVFYFSGHALHSLLFWGNVALILGGNELYSMEVGCVRLREVLDQRFLRAYTRVFCIRACTRATFRDSKNWIPVHFITACPLEMVCTEESLVAHVYNLRRRGIFVSGHLCPLK
jgi:hypothetical protein